MRVKLGRGLVTPSNLLIPAPDQTAETLVFANLTLPLKVAPERFGLLPLFVGFLKKKGKAMVRQ